MTIRVVVADDQGMVRSGFTVLLNRTGRTISNSFGHGDSGLMGRLAAVPPRPKPCGCKAWG